MYFILHRGFRRVLSVFFENTDAGGVASAPVMPAVGAPWYGEWFHVAVLLWLCVISALLLALSVGLYKVYRHHRHLLHQGNVQPLEREPSPISPRSLGRPSSYMCVFLMFNNLFV